jgi:xanthine dehydrogenase accessory factor
MPSIILLRGGGDLASGVAIRLIHSGLSVIITELLHPLAVRRTVSFAESIYTGEVQIEGITAHRVDDPGDVLRIKSILGKQQIPVLVDPLCTSSQHLHPTVIVDGRMTKHSPEPIGYSPALYIGLGPGFEAGVNCQAVIETRRGPTLGRVFWSGGPEPDTGQPDGDPARVLRARSNGVFITHAQIGDHIEKDQLIAEIDDGQQILDRSRSAILGPFQGILRGLLHHGLTVTCGLKVGDIDPRNDARLYQLVSDKAMAIGGGVLEAILSRSEVRSQLWN